jgi:site-specific DNA-adenine methylase
LNDVQTHSFLKALQSYDSRDLPATITKDDYITKYQKSNSATALVLEPRITFRGSGYTHTGFAMGTGSHVGYTKNNYSLTVDAAKELLTGATIDNKDWTKCTIWNKLGPEDFVYLDPPYLDNTDKRYYPSIDHGLLLTKLENAPFKWILSGYDSDLYRKRKGKPFKCMVRELQMKVVKKDTLDKRIECLWKNF